MNGFNWGLSDNISTYGGAIDQMMSTLHWFMVALFLFWGVFFVYCLVKFRARAGHKATYEPIHATWSKYLEIGVAIFEGAILFFFSVPVWSRFKHGLPPRNQATQVRIVAQQFAWNFWYPGPDGKFGKSSLTNISGGNPVGLDDDDADGKDDIVVANNLYFPADKPVIADLTSKDVIHSFGVPTLRLRQDAIPGMNITFWFQTEPKDLAAAMKHAADQLPAAQAELDAATKAFDPVSKRPDADKTPEKAAMDRAQIAVDGLKENASGAFDIACSQLCGNGHGRMRGVLHAMAPADYAKWLADKEIEKNPPEETPTPAATPAASATPTPKAAATAKPAETAKPAASAATSSTPGTQR